MTPDLSFYLSHVRVDLYCPLPDVLRALRAIWSGASVPMVETTSTAAVEIEADAPHRVYCNGDAVDSLDESDQLLPNIEAVLYHLLREWHSELTLLHAALLQQGDETFLLTGPSGSGKSSLALQALRAGWLYATDEITVTDGGCIWGIPRAVQFDPVPISRELPAFLADIDTDSYRWPHPEAGLLCQPLMTPPENTCMKPASLDSVNTIILDGTADPGLHHVDAIDALKHLHQACFTAPQHDLGSLASRAWTFNWTDPQSAVNQLQQICCTGDAA